MRLPSMLLASQGGLQYKIRRPPASKSGWQRWEEGKHRGALGGKGSRETRVLCYRSQKSEDF